MTISTFVALKVIAILKDPSNANILSMDDVKNSRIYQFREGRETNFPTGPVFGEPSTGGFLYSLRRSSLWGIYKRMRQMARMKITNISLLLICFLISAFFYSGAFASTIVYKDKHGKCLKRAIVKANETIYYDCHGKYLGKEVKRGKKVYIYDNHGNYKGSMNY